MVSLSLAFANVGWTQSAAIPPSIIPQGFGVNIHFTDPMPGEMEKLAESGLQWVRMDLIWEATEKEPGKYDFSAYDRLVRALDKHKIKALFILDYTNPLYDGGLAPHTKEGRRAFACWAVAAAKHFSGKGFLWEIWNEPNNRMFWKPKPDARDYSSLALEVGQRFRKEVPEETPVGPASSGFPRKYLKIILQSGVLHYLGGVTVHPYRKGHQPPETAYPDYTHLQKWIAKYSSANPTLPILSGEWGYSTAPEGRYETLAAKFAPRMFLYNLSRGVPLSIWYDWRDDGPDAHENEYNFGLLRFPGMDPKHPQWQEKPAFLSLKTLNQQLQGFRFEKRLSGVGANNHVLQFRRGDERRLAVWTSSKIRRRIKIPGLKGNWDRVDYLGRTLGPLRSTRRGFWITLTDGPQYLRKSSQP